MKKILLIGCLLCANLQAQVYNFESAATGSSGGITTTTVQDSTGWKRVGTTAFNTGATYYRIAGKYQRLILVDTDNDSVIIAPHALFPLAGKDATSLLFAFDSTGRLGLNALTSAQARRAMFNVLGRAANDTLLVFSNDGGGVVGDSSALMNGAGEWGFGTGPSAGIRANVSGILQANNIYAVSTVRIAGATMLSGTNPLKVGEQSTTIEITPPSTGFIGLGTNTAGQRQAFVTIRTQTPTADTLFMARNNKTATLDSTFMVFANGRIVRRDTKQLPAGAWIATASNGAALSSSNYMVTYAFDTATAETLTVDFALPPNFIQISSVEIEVISPNTDGDSVGYAIAWLGRAADEAFNVAFSSPLSGQIDLGTTANVRKILTISGTFSNLAASDRIIFKLWRDPSVDNDVATDVHFVEMRVNGNGLLH